MTSDTIELTVGDRIPGHKWVVVRKIAEGGMGATFEVVKPPGIRGVMKVILPSLARRHEYVDRFFEEVRVLTLLQHPNIVQVIDHDLLSDGTPFFVMERLEGKTLRDTLRRRAKALPPRIVYEVMRQLCDGLYRVHSHNPPIVHRDIKPANLFLHRPEFAEPTLKILDFGVASMVGGDRTGAFFGTPRYAAPEQLRNEQVTLKADLYAVGLILYEMLAGRGPFDDFRDEKAPQLYRAAPSARAFAPWIPPTTDILLAQVLSPNPEARPRDAYALISKLYELQFLSAGDVPVAEINTTAPTLATLIVDDASEAADNQPGDRADAHDATYEGMTPPPIGGHSLELAPADLVKTQEDVVTAAASHDMSPNTLPASEPSVGVVQRPAPPPTTVVDARGAISEAGTAQSVAATSQRLRKGRGTAMVLAAVAVTGLFAGWLVLRPGERVAARETAPASALPSTVPVAIAVSSSVASAAAPINVAAASPGDAPAPAAVPTADGSAPRADAKAAMRGVALPAKLAPLAAPRTAKSAEPDDGRDLLFDPSKR